MLLPALLTAAALAGLVLLALGLRGRRVSDHPHCRACGFDLAGLDLASPCPECGADLGARRAVRAGRRRPRRLPVGIGVVLLLVALGGGGAMGWAAASGFNWNTIKPYAWLMSDARSASPARARAAGAELARRATAGTLGRERTGQVVNLALEAQSTRTNAWTPELGDMMDVLYLKRQVDDATYGRYAVHAVAFDVLVRDQTPADRPVTLWLQSRGAAIGDNSVVSAWLEVTGFDVDGAPRGDGQAAMPGGAGMQVGAMGTSSRSLDPGQARWEVGSHSVEWRMDLLVFPPATPPWSLSPEERQSRSIGRRAITLRAEFEVLPPGEETVAFAPSDAETDAAMAAAITRIEFRRLGAELHYAVDYAGQRPVDAAFDLICTVSGMEAPAVRVTIPAGTWPGGTAGAIRLPPEYPEAPTADVRLEASLGAAYGVPGLRLIWDGVIERDGVPVVTPGGETPGQGAAD